jgi:hypothetical protein
MSKDAVTVLVLVGLVAAFQVWQQQRRQPETFDAPECLNLANLSPEYWAGLSSFIASVHQSHTEGKEDPLHQLLGMKQAMVGFLTPQQTYAFLLADGDGYVANMEGDRVFRNLGYTNKKEYLEHASRYAVGYNAKEKARIYEMCGIVEVYMNAYFHTTPAQQASVPWYFALTQGRAFENGEPHIRKAPYGSIIFMGTRWMYEIIDDTCAFGWMLLYWRLGIFAARCLLPQPMVKHIWEHVPWAAHKRPWELADTQPTCAFFQRAEKLMKEGYNTLT